MNLDILIGKNKTQLVNIPNSDKLIHKDALDSFLNLKESASQNGFQLEIASSHRSYDRQLEIWNKKISGELEILDDLGVSIPIDELSNYEKVFFILRWSAIPGFSRHHWGTDLDIYDSNNIDSNYKISLTPNECKKNGPFYEIHCWLDSIIDSNSAFNFFRPYDKDIQGVASEKWHISHKKTAQQFEAQLSLEIFKDLISSSKILGKEILLDHSSQIFNKYILNT